MIRNKGSSFTPIIDSPADNEKLRAQTNAYARNGGYAKKGHTSVAMANII